MKNNKKDVIIDVIETPKGHVPTAESIKSLVEAWNDILSTMNSNLEKIIDMFSNITKKLEKMDITLSKFLSKLDNFSKDIIEIKLVLKSLEKIFFESKKKDSKNTEKIKPEKVLREMFPEED